MCSDKALAGLDEIHQGLAWVAIRQEHTGGIEKDAIKLLEVLPRDRLDGILGIDGGEDTAFFADFCQHPFRLTGFLPLAVYRLVTESC